MKYLIFNSLVALCLASCQSGNKPAIDFIPVDTSTSTGVDYYDERLQAVVMLPEIQKLNSEKQCITVYVLQPNSCNTCSIEIIRNVKDQIQMTSSPSVIVYSTEDESEDHFIERNFKGVAVETVHIDSKRAESLGLLMEENIQLEICGQTITEWKVLGKPAVEDVTEPEHDI